jgi:hypothetical protein
MSVTCCGYERRANHAKKIARVVPKNKRAARGTSQKPLGTNYLALMGIAKMHIFDVINNIMSRKFLVNLPFYIV